MIHRQRSGAVRFTDLAAPLPRALVPIEKRTVNGTLVFRTSDKAVYMRLEDGSIRRAIPKENGKAARKRRRTSR